jgi:hypothetical protein
MLESASTMPLVSNAVALPVYPGMTCVPSELSRVTWLLSSDTAARSKPGLAEIVWLAGLS